MRIKLSMTALLLSMCLSAIAQNNKYTVKGNLSGEDVPMKVFLFYRVGNKQVSDSTIAKNNKFTLSGSVDYPLSATLYIHKMHPEPKGTISEGVQFMLEPGLTTVEGVNLLTANISGGKAQTDYLKLTKMEDRIRDSVYKIWRTQQGVLPEDSAAAFNRLIYAQRVVLKKATQKFVYDNPTSAASFNVLQTSTTVVEDIPFVESLLTALRPEFGTSEQYKLIFEKVDIAKRLSIGQPATEFSQTDENGNMISLSAARGKYVLVDFWASWCGPCRTEYPFLKEAYSKFRSKNFEIIGISLDDKKASWLDAIKSNGFEWIQLSDLKGRENTVAKLYGVSAIPQNFLIDPEGKIVAKNLRGDELVETIAKMIRTN